MAKATDIRVTPDDVMAQLREQYGDFELDAAALKSNRQVAYYFGPDHRNPFLRNALAPSLRWSAHGKLVFLNCPYSEIPKWLRKVKQEIKLAPASFRIVCLLPSSTSTIWWHKYIWHLERREWRPLVRSAQFWPRRINFGPHKTGAKWPSVVIEFGRPV